MPMALMTKPRMKKKTAEEKTAVSSAPRPAAETGAEFGIPLFLRRMTASTAIPAMIQRQPIEEEEEQLLQSTPADGVIQRQEEEALLQKQPLDSAAVQRQIEPEEEEEEPLQPKLTVGRPDDVYEQQADDVAERVMRLPEPVLARKPS